MHGRAKTSLPEKRHENAMEALTRIATLRLPLHIAQQLIEVIVIPKTCFHVQARPLQDIWCQRLRRTINVATGVRYRGLCNEVVAALFRRPHRYDPRCAAMYSHIVAILITLRTDREMKEQWRRLSICSSPEDPEALLAFVSSIFRRWWAIGGFSCGRPEGGLTCERPRKLTWTFLSSALGTGTLAIKGNSVWTQKRRAAAGWVNEAICPFCELGRKRASSIFCMNAQRETDSEDGVAVCRQNWVTCKMIVDYVGCALKAPAARCRVNGEFSNRDAPVSLRLELVVTGILWGRGTRRRLFTQKPVLTSRRSVDSRMDWLMIGRKKGKLPFEMTLTLGGQIRWHCAREQWHRMSWYASLLSYPRQEDLERVPYATYLGFTLAYMCANVGERCREAIGSPLR